VKGFVASPHRRSGTKKKEEDKEKNEYWQQVL
jgi:hypothetical protein